VAKHQQNRTPQGGAAGTRVEGSDNTQSRTTILKEARKQKVYLTQECAKKIAKKCQESFENQILGSFLAQNGTTKSK